MNKKLGKIVVVGVEQLGGTVIIIDDEWCFLTMLRLKDLYWSCNSKCDPNLYATLHKEMIILQIYYCKH